MSFAGRHPSSYRDPSGFLFYHNSRLYRQVNRSFQKDFEQFISSGIYQHLIDKGLLIPHQQVDQNFTGTANWYTTLEPEVIPFISYPYEWCFAMLKDAALTTLEIAGEAIKFGMILKDASAYNVQWHNGRMKFIDTLSFEKWDEGKPWIAYRQFCEHFFAPLALMHFKKQPVSKWFLAYPEGIPVELASSLLPYKSKWHLHTYLHVHLHARVSQKKQTKETAKTFSTSKLKNLLRSLEEAVRSFSLDVQSGVWSDYYDEAFQRENYLEPKKQIINDLLENLEIKSAMDVGANEGEFSQLAASKNVRTISVDFDHYSINRLYKKINEGSIHNILPLVMDLSAPSPAIGLNNTERTSFLDRVNVDLVMALAVIHHLCIGKNIPFDDLVKMFANMGSYLLIEFVPRFDEKIEVMLQQKKDVYDWYTIDNFKSSFSKEYEILNFKTIGTTKRELFLMKRK
ncbi:MAG TPA: class I SAM-dependent methyltransferase [Flavisolibacter sp.]|nr:class I SAM-dependent methyltransferase [Flavisolibacter sp.]